MIARLVLAVWSGIHALRQVPDALVVTRPEVRRDGPGVARRGPSRRWRQAGWAVMVLKRQVRDVSGDNVWAVFGPRGVVSWGLIGHAAGRACFAPISVHSPRPQFDWSTVGPDDDCPFLEMPCYIDNGYLAGDHLGKAWEETGRDDEVIWAELEQWYESRFAHLGAVAS